MRATTRKEASEQANRHQNIIRKHCERVVCWFVCRSFGRLRLSFLVLSLSLSPPLLRPFLVDFLFPFFSLGIHIRHLVVVRHTLSARPVHNTRNNTNIIIFPCSFPTSKHCFDFSKHAQKQSKSQHIFDHLTDSSGRMH